MRQHNKKLQINLQGYEISKVISTRFKILHSPWAETWIPSHSSPGPELWIRTRWTWAALPAGPWLQHCKFSGFLLSVSSSSPLQLTRAPGWQADTHAVLLLSHRTLALRARWQRHLLGVHGHWQRGRVWIIHSTDFKRPEMWKSDFSVRLELHGCGQRQETIK